MKIHRSRPQGKESITVSRDVGAGREGRHRVPDWAGKFWGTVQNKHVNVISPERQRELRQLIVNSPSFCIEDWFWGRLSDASSLPCAQGDRGPITRTDGPRGRRSCRCLQRAALLCGCECPEDTGRVWLWLLQVWDNAIWKMGSLRS